MPCSPDASGITATPAPSPASSPTSWPEDDRTIDPRPLQDPHDVLAAVWRWHAAPPHPRLALDGPPRAYDMTDWLHWLREEVAEWHAEPDLMLAMVEIVADADGDAPARLAAALRMRHAGVPWHGQPVPGRSASIPQRA
ncbi:hypothetical protein AB5I41_29040 [Sphingomonas sp. MMS24-JH45]